MPSDSTRKYPRTQSLGSREDGVSSLQVPWALYIPRQQDCLEA